MVAPAVTYCGPLSDAGETEQVLATLRPSNRLQLEPQQTDRASVNILLLLPTAAAGVMITVLVVGHVSAK